MPCYVLRCNYCEEQYEIFKGMHDPLPKKCKYCGKHKLYQIYNTHHFESPKTVGSLCDRNADKMSDEQKEEIRPGSTKDLTDYKRMMRMLSRGDKQQIQHYIEKGYLPK